MHECGGGTFPADDTPCSRLEQWAGRLFLLLSLLLLSGCSDPKARVVLYCAQDREFAEQVFDGFARQTSLRVVPRFDTEANKSVSLYEDLVREAKHPRCDVHWNNEILGTIRLQKQGLLDPYKSPAAAPYPPFAKASDDTWHAFAARARVLIINTKLVADAERPRGLFDLLDARWKGKVAMAKPQFGTTATQAACLFQALGDEPARQFYRGLKQNGVGILPGNKQVAEAVGTGQYAVGMTDTDDAAGEVEAGRPVAIVFPDRDSFGTLFIPNTLAVIKGCPNPEGARKLVDYLLSPEVEAKLAETASHQIPLNPQVQAKLPAWLETPTTVKPMDVNFEKAADQWEAVQAFLREEFARPLP